MSIKAFKAIIFDLDGTLVDSAPDITVALNQLLAESNLAPYDLDAVRLMIGAGVKKLVERAFRGRDFMLPPETLIQKTDHMIDLYSHRPARQTRAFAGADSLLTRLHQRGVKIALCTNKPYAITLSVLAAFGWDRLFEAVIGGDSAAARKPDPAPLKLALDRMKISAQECLMVGDSAADVKAAQALGMKCFLLRHGYSKTPVDDLGADQVFDGLEGVHSSLLGESEAV